MGRGDHNVRYASVLTGLEPYEALEVQVAANAVLDGLDLSDPLTWRALLVAAVRALDALGHSRASMFKPALAALLFRLYGKEHR